jgi:EAL domain-containing protein (putative c-di-GMP-specific phosphodiesterase class I)
MAARRMAMFAFTSADLLVELDDGGTIRYAEGAFPRYFSKPGEAFIGQSLDGMLDAGDRGLLARILTILTRKSRISPVVVRLASSDRSALVLNAMRVEAPVAGVFVTFGKAPAEAIDPDAFVIHSINDFADRAVERMLADAEQASLTLLEVDGKHGEIPQADIHRAIHQSVPADATIGDMAPGRFGIMHPDIDPVELERNIVEALHRFGRNATVSATAISLATGDMPAERAVPILQMLLESFVNEGAPGLAAASGGRGLAGALEEIRVQSRRIASAIREEAFELEYQPICEIRTREVHHYEALIRPAEGLPPSYRFVRVAEEAGISELLDLAVLKRVVGVAKGRTIVAVNVSGYSVQKHDFQKHFAETIKNKTKNVIVELTETAEIQDRTTAGHFFENLNRMGVSICLDDFGAGAAGFQYIRDFPVDFIKVDGSYVRAAPVHARQRAILYSIMEMAQTIGARTIAEFVETEEQARLVESMGGQFIQGWLVGKPGPLMTIDSLVRGSGLRR